MYHAVKAQLEVIAARHEIPDLPRKLAEFAARLERIAALHATWWQPMWGTLAVRDRALADLVDDTLTMAGLVLCHAEEHNRPDLAALVRVKPSHFAVRHLEQLMLARRVHEAAASVLPALAIYHVTPGMLADLEARIAVATEAITQPWCKKSQKAAASSQLTLVFRETDRLLQRSLDPLLMRLRKTDPSLHAAYVSARAIVHRRGPRRAAAEPLAPALETTSAPEASSPPLPLAAPVPLPLAAVPSPAACAPSAPFVAPRPATTGTPPRVLRRRRCAISPSRFVRTRHARGAALARHASPAKPAAGSLTPLERPPSPALAENARPAPDSA